MPGALPSTLFNPPPKSCCGSVIISTLMEGKLRHRQGHDLPGSQLGNGKGGSDAGKPTPRPHSKLPDDPNLPAFLWELIIASETRGFINPQCPVMPGPVAAMLPPQSVCRPSPLCHLPTRQTVLSWFREGVVD